MQNQVNRFEVISESNHDTVASQEVYTEVVDNTSFAPLLKQEIICTNDEQNPVLSSDEYHSALKCFNELNKKCQFQKVNYYVKEEYNDDENHHLKNSRDSLNKGHSDESESIPFKATDDESMAVEALRQLGGMFPPNEPEPVFTCNICSMTFKILSDLESHNLTCRSQIYRDFRCSVCNFVFDDEQNYNNHKCIVTKLPCKYCYTYFSTRSELEKHIEANHNSDRPYKCQFCDLAFLRSSSLANHLKIHNYLPGRALLPNSTKIGPDPTNSCTWTFESVYVSENPVNNSSVDSLSNWNLDYASNPLMQVERNEEVSTTPDDFSQQTDNNKPNDNLDFEMPVKVEIVPYVTDIEKCLDESFPITSMPQMEVIVGTDTKKSHVCSHCGMNFARQKALMSHLKLHSIGWLSTSECKTCGESFTNDKLLSEHEKSCGVDLSDDQAQKKDTIKIKNLPKPQVKVGKHRCQECDKHFTTKQKMFRHLWIHRKKTFTCEFCALSFEVQAELDKHRLSQHPVDSPYVCNECGKCFASRQGLWEHGRVHGGGTANLFTCDKCNKRFASRQGFLIHHRTHTDERPYGCRFCLKAFRDGGTLRKHERIHTGYRPYICPICTHDFNQKVVLREHVRWVHVANKTENENGMFICQICNINVSDREELCAHIVKHSDIMLLEAKNNLKDPSIQSIKKNLQSKTKVTKIENASSKEAVKSKQKQLEALDYNISQCNFTQDQNSVECDLCGSKFTSQKDLMTHVHIHI